MIIHPKEFLTMLACGFFGIAAICLTLMIQGCENPSCTDFDPPVFCDTMEPDDLPTPKTPTPEVTPDDKPGDLPLGSGSGATPGSETPPSCQTGSGDGSGSGVPSEPSDDDDAEDPDPTTDKCREGRQFICSWGHWSRCVKFREFWVLFPWHEKGPCIRGHHHGQGKRHGDHDED